MSGTGGVDASIPLQAGRGTTQPENPLQALGNVANTANALNQLKLFPGQQQLQQGQIALQRQGIQSGAGNLAQQWYQQASNGVLPLLQKWASDPTQAKMSDLTAVMGGMEAGGTGTQPFMSRFLSLGTPANGVDLYNQLRTIAVPGSQTDAGAALATVVGMPGTMNTGPAIQPGMVAGVAGPNAGAFTKSGAPVQVYPSRSELAAQVTQIDNNPKSPTYGQQIAVPLATRLNAQGAGGLAGPAGGVMGVAGPASPASPPRLAPAAPGGGVASSGAVPVGLPPGAQTELDASAQHYASDNVAANTFQQRVFPLTQAATSLSNVGTGPGTQPLNQIKSFLLAQSPDVLKQFLPGVDPNKIASYDEAVKYLAQYAMNQPGAANSDMHLGLAQVANASTHISNQAAQQVVQNALGLERMRQAATLQFNDTHPPGSGAQYDRFLSTFATANDPRGFSWDTQTPAQRQAAMTGMTRAAKERLLGSITLARQYGLNGGAGGQ